MIEIKEKWIESLIEYADKAEDTFNRENDKDVKKLVKHKLSGLFGYINSAKYLLK